MTNVVNLRESNKPAAMPAVVSAPRSRSSGLPAPKTASPPSPVSASPPLVHSPAPEQFADSEMLEQAADTAGGVAWETKLHHAFHSKQVIGICAAAVAGGLGMWFLDKNVTGIIFLALMLGVLYLNQQRRSEPAVVEVTDTAVVVKDKAFHHKNTKSFWIEYNPDGIKELSLQLDRWYSPYVKIPLGAQDPAELHATLSAVIPEEEHELSLIDILSRRHHH